LIIYCAIPQVYSSMYRLSFMLFETPTFWIGLVLAIGTCLLLDFALMSGQALFFPRDWHIVNEIQKASSSLPHTLLAPAPPTVHSILTEKDPIINMSPVSTLSGQEVYSPSTSSAFLPSLSSTTTS